MADTPEFGVNFETGEITRPAPEDSTPQHDTQPQIDDTFNAFDEEGEEGPPPGGQPPRSAPEMLPKYRLDETTEQLRQTREQLAAVAEERGRLLSMIERLSHPQTPTPPGEQPKPLPEGVQRVRDQLMSVVPEFKEFVENRPRIMKAIELVERLEPKIGSMEEDTKRFWGSVADSALDASLSAVAQHMKLPQALDPKSRMGQIVQQQFFQFAASNPRNVARYEAQDPSLIAEFVKEFDKEVLGFGRPAHAAPSGPPRQDQRRLPVAGRTSPTPGQQPPKPNLDDEDEVMARGWQAVLNARQAMTP